MENMNKHDEDKNPTNDSDVNWNVSLFDDVIDPFEEIAVSEHNNGILAGRRAGYLEGRDIGRSKAWEIGLELGYIHSFATNLLDLHQQRLKQMDDSGPQIASSTIGNRSSAVRSNNRLDRFLAVSQELIDMVNKFPDPDFLLEQHGSVENNDDITSVGHLASELIDAEELFNDSEVVSETAAHDASLTDITSSLQRIRAKFKLLLVLLRTESPFDLKSLFSECDVENQAHGIDKRDTSELKGTMKSTVRKEDDW